MTTAWVLGKFMPPHKGHEALLHFAAALADMVNVVTDTASDEPMIYERINAVTKMMNRVAPSSNLYWIENIEEDHPKDDNDFAFWGMWHELLTNRGFKKGDYIVGSETYCVKLAALMQGVFIPFDMKREISSETRATLIRDNLIPYAEEIIPEFIPYLQRTVTVFGAESTGKTYTTQWLAEGFLDAEIRPEWARQYLETVGSEVTDEKMLHIVEGQLALQQMCDSHPGILKIQDTDLFSTLGYWRMYSPDTVCAKLDELAYENKSDLYLIMASDIEFEPDELRYGGDKRESQDQYWIDLAKEFDLNYVYITGTYSERVDKASEVVRQYRDNWFVQGNPLRYTRS